MAFLALWTLFSLLLLQVFSQSGPSKWTISPFNPPALPIAVRSPYLNVWLAQGNNPPALPAVPTDIWTMASVSGWYASAVVDDKEYRLLGQYYSGELTPNQTAVEFTATRTSFLTTAGGVQFNISFLSPIEPRNFTLQSLPYAYLYMTAESIDGQKHRVRMYSDVTGNLITGNPTKVVEWSSEDTSDYVVLSMRLQSQVSYDEDDNHPQDAIAYYSFKKISSATTSWSIASIDETRGIFVGNPSGGSLNNQADPVSTYRPMTSGSDSPVIGIAIDWGNITSTPEPAVWALGIVRDPSVQYLTTEGSYENRSPYFASAFTDQVGATVSDAQTKFVLDDFPRALDAAEALDAQIRADGEAISSDYADLLVLSARQAMGAMEITIPLGSRWTWDTSDVKIFMKNLGSIGSDNGVLMSVNNVDVLNAAFPAFLYFNPDIAGYLLAPLLDYQGSEAYKLSYAAKNIGTAYPSAISNNISEPHNSGVDTTANMIIMTLAYSMASGNGTLIRKHYDLLRSWAKYLSSSSINPSNQSSGDNGLTSDFTRSNQTNLALKGIIAISAMAKIAQVAGEGGDQKTFSKAAASGLQIWQDQAVSSSHVNFVYGASDTSGLMYNLYADKLLGLNLVPEAVYTMLTEYYQDTASSNSYGVALNSSPGQNTTTHGMIFAASTTTNSTTRDLLVSQIRSYASNSLNSVPFCSVYDPVTGLAGLGRNIGTASPAQGGMFALLALNTTTKTIALTADLNKSSMSSEARNGIIAGSVLASVAVCSAVGLFFFIRRRGRLHETVKAHPDASYSTDTSVTPAYMLSRRDSTQYTVTGVPGSWAAESYVPDSAGICRTGDAYLGNMQQRMDCRPSKYEQARMDTIRLGTISSVASMSPHENYSFDDSQGVSGLRSELNYLRQNMEWIQHRLAVEEAPPLYSDPR